MSAFKDQLDDLIKRADALQADALLLVGESTKHLCAAEMVRAYFRAQDTALGLKDVKTQAQLHDKLLEASNAG